MDIRFKRKDFWLALLAGEIVALLSLPTLKNLKILDYLLSFGISFNSFLIFWAIFVPAGALAGLSFFYFIGRWKQRVGFWELGKYGVIGVLNTLLNAGVYNLLIFMTDIAAGLYLDLFFVIAFVITVINSFFWNKYWAFEDQGEENVQQEAFQFFAVSSITALINTGILHFVVTTVGAPEGIDPKIWANAGLGLAIIVAFLGNFFGYKYLVFKK